MSPLARPLLALAAAATLLAACAAGPAVRPGPLANCIEILMGRQSSYVVTFGPMTEPAIAILDVPDVCSYVTNDWTLVGQKVTACSEVVVPILKALVDKKSPVIAISGDDKPVIVNVVQYCEILVN